MRYLALLLMLALFPLGAKAQEPNAFPECNDAALLEGVREAIAKDENALENESVVDYRARLLALKNVRNFTPLDVASFHPDDNRRVADILITAKINEGLTNADFRLCASDNPILKRRIFLLMRPAAEGLEVDIVNYRFGAIPSFIYKK